MTTIYPSGDTIRVRVTFRDYAVAPTLGAVIDPDSITVKIYDSKENLVETIGGGDVVHESTGIYYYDWTLDEGTFFIEFSGDFGGNPEIKRAKIKSKWKAGA